MIIYYNFFKLDLNIYNWFLLFIIKFLLIKKLFIVFEIIIIKIVNNC